MYVIAPAVSSPYRWLNVPLNALRSDRWPEYIPSPWAVGQSLDSYYVMIPMELRQSILRRAGWAASSRWSLAVWATATMVTGAVALYYYAPWSELDLSMDQFLSLPFNTDGDFGMMPEYSSEFVGEDDDDDDELVDPDLLDGFGPRGGNKVMNVVLTSSDPTSELCHKPLMLDLANKKSASVPPSRAQSVCHTSPSRITLPCQEDDASSSSEDAHDDVDEQTRSSVPSILKRDSQPFPSALLCNPLTLSYDSPRQSKRMARYASRDSASHSPLAHLISPRSGSALASSETDTPRSLDTDRSYSRSSVGSPRSVVLTEPDWTPFTDIHDRARKRAVVANLVSTVNELHSQRSSPTKKGKSLPILESLPFEPPQELGDGSEFWFERFTRSTAAAGKHWDWRRRSSTELVEQLDSELANNLAEIHCETEPEKSADSKGKQDSALFLSNPASPFAPTMPIEQGDDNAPLSPTSLAPHPAPALPNNTTSRKPRPGNLNLAPLSPPSLVRSESTPSPKTEHSFTPTKRKFDLDMDKVEVSASPESRALNSSSISHMAPSWTDVTRIPQLFRRGTDSDMFTTSSPRKYTSVAKRRLKDKLGNRFRMALVDT